MSGYERNLFAQRQHIIGWLACSCWIVPLLWASTTPSRAHGGVVPGHALGKIEIGETRQDVLTSAQRGPEGRYELNHGISEDEWIRHLPSKYGFDSVYVTVWYKHSRVVQVRFLDTRVGRLGLPSFITLIAINKNLKKSC